MTSLLRERERERESTTLVIALCRYHGWWTGWFESVDIARPVEAPVDTAGYSLSRVISAFKAVARAQGYRRCEVRDYTCEESDEFEVLSSGALHHTRRNANYYPVSRKAS